MKSMSFHTAALLADSINDASSTRKVYLLAAGLALLGIALIAVTVWFWRSTRHDPELLAPLEVMGARRFRRLDGGAQQHVLDRSRPVDAKPMRWGVVRGEASGDPEVDLTQILRNSPAGFDDLRDPALIAVALQETDDASSDPAIAVPTFVPHTSAGSVDPLADLDSALAAAGAKIDGVSPVAGISPVDGVSPEGGVAPVVGISPVVDVSPVADGAPPELVGGAVATQRAAVEEPAPITERTGPRGSKPGAKPVAAMEGVEGVDAVAGVDASASVPPLVIVPVDHDLRPSRARRVEPEPEPIASRDSEQQHHDVTAAAVLPDGDDVDDEPVSIDPLLRAFNRNES